MRLDPEALFGSIWGVLEAKAATSRASLAPNRVLSGAPVAPEDAKNDALGRSDGSLAWLRRLLL